MNNWLQPASIHNLGYFSPITGTASPVKLLLPAHLNASYLFQYLTISEHLPQRELWNKVYSGLKFMQTLTKVKGKKKQNTHKKDNKKNMSHHRLLRGLQWHMERCTHTPWCHHTSKHTKCWQATYKSSNRITIRIMRHLKRHLKKKKKQPEIKSKEKYNAECKPRLQISAASKHCVGKCCLEIKHALFWGKKKKKSTSHSEVFLFQRGN